MHRKPIALACSLVLLTLLALGLRFTGIGFMLPHLTEPDDFILAQLEAARPGSLLGARADDTTLTEGARNAYPELVTRLLLLWPAANEPTSASLEDGLRRTGRPFVHARMLVALLAVLLVPATFFLARRFLSGGWSLFAAALVATSLLHFNFSQQARPHAVTASTALLAVLAAMRVQRRGRVLDYLMAFGAAVLAVGSLQSGALALVALPVAHALRSRGSRRLWGLVIAGLALLVAVAVFYPAHVPIDASPETNPIMDLHILRLTAYDGTGFAHIFSELGSYDPLLLALALLGVIAMVVQRTPVGPEAIVAAGHALAYLLVFGLYFGTKARYLVTLLPYLACLAAFGTRGIARFAALRVRFIDARMLATAVCVSVLALPTWAVVELARLRAADDTCTRVSEWIGSHLDPAEHRIALTPGLDLPLRQSAASLELNVARALGVLRMPWFHAQRSLASGDGYPSYHLVMLPFLEAGFRRQLREDPAAALRSLDCDYLILAEFADGRTSMMHRRVRIGLGEVADMVSEFSPLRTVGGRALPLLAQVTPGVGTGFLRCLARARAVGPAIEVYRFRPK